MKKKLYGILIFSLFVTTVFCQTTRKKFFLPLAKDQTWTVPAGVTQINVKLWGAGGAGGNYQFNDIGGGGGFATAILSVTPGEILTIIVGARGLTGAGPGAYGGGGGKACGVGGRGGGRSAIRNSSGIELITAGAGGGGGGVAQDYQTGGHAGGGLEGQPDVWLPYGGGAGTQTAGGSPGTWGSGGCTCGGQAGSQFLGGYAGCYDNGYNGSGGGGYYGGGSGTDIGDGAGGGGSSFIPEGGKTMAGTNNIPGNTADPDYRFPIGYGGKKGKPGYWGLVVTSYNTYSEESNAQNDIQISVSPNPSKGNINVTHYSNTNGKARINIYGMESNMVFTTTEQVIKGINTSHINLSKLKPGIYYLELNNGTTSKHTKFIIER